MKHLAKRILRWAAARWLLGDGKYDFVRDTWRIEGLTFTGDFFRAMAEAPAEWDGQKFEMRRRPGGAVEIARAAAVPPIVHGGMD